MSGRGEPKRVFDKALQFAEDRLEHRVGARVRHGVGEGAATARLMPEYGHLSGKVRDAAVGLSQPLDDAAAASPNDPFTVEAGVWIGGALDGEQPGGFPFAPLVFWKHGIDLHEQPAGGGGRDGQEMVKPKAYVSLAEGHTATTDLKEELKAFVKGRLAPHKYPRWIEFLEELPRTATGKLQRHKLRS